MLTPELRDEVGTELTGIIFKAMDKYQLDPVDVSHLLATYPVAFIATLMDMTGISDRRLRSRILDNFEKDVKGSVKIMKRGPYLGPVS